MKTCFRNLSLGRFSGCNMVIRLQPSNNVSPDNLDNRENSVSLWSMMILKEKDKPKGKRERSFKAIELELWEVFALFIKLRDAERGTGLCFCFTCGVPKHWSEGDCGHGVGRGHGATKYNERNNHFQCKGCNGFNEGRKDLYEKKMDAKYGAGTWAMMWQASKSRATYGRFELTALTTHYAHEVLRVMKEKALPIPKAKMELVQRILKRN